MKNTLNRRQLHEACQRGWRVTRWISHPRGTRVQIVDKHGAPRTVGFVERGPGTGLRRR